MKPLAKPDPDKKRSVVEDTDIVIYTTREKLEHKKAKPEDRMMVAYWTLHNLPKRFDNDENNVYFAVGGYVVGYFEGEKSYFYAGKRIPRKAIQFNPNRWVELKKPITCKPFQGFKYRWFDVE